jgi:hypothetical protein
VAISVNDEQQWGFCWICGLKEDHDGSPHGEATGDGLTRYDIIEYMQAGGHTSWRSDD